MECCATCKHWGHKDDPFLCHDTMGSRGKGKDLVDGNPTGSAVFIICPALDRLSHELRTGPEFSCGHWKQRSDE